MIEIGKVIYNILSSATGVTSSVGTRMFPLVAPSDTAFPLIVYDRRSNPNDTKDDSLLYQTSVEITILDADYADGIEIALEVQQALEYYSGTNSGITVRKIKLIGVDEQYSDDAYVQKLSFMVISV